MAQSLPPKPPVESLNPSRRRTIERLRAQTKALQDWQDLARSRGYCPHCEAYIGDHGLSLHEARCLG